MTSRVRRVCSPRTRRPRGPYLDVLFTLNNDDDDDPHPPHHRRSSSTLRFVVASASRHGVRPRIVERSHGQRTSGGGMTWQPSRTPVGAVSRRRKQYASTVEARLHCALVSRSPRRHLTDHHRGTENRSRDGGSSASIDQRHEWSLREGPGLGRGENGAHDFAGAARHQRANHAREKWYLGIECRVVTNDELASRATTHTAVIGPTRVPHGGVVRSCNHVVKRGRTDSPASSSGSGKPPLGDRQRSGTAALLERKSPVRGGNGYENDTPRED